MSAPDDGTEQSLVWRCGLCGRLHLFVAPARHPVACHDCGNDSFTGSSGHRGSFPSAMPESQDADLDDPQGTQ
jgi:hypothetical protein